MRDEQPRDLDELILRPWWRIFAAWVLIALGGLFILLGWVGVATNPAVARQMSYIASGGIGGLVCAIVGVGLLVSEDLRSERKRLGRIEATLLDVKELLVAQAEALSSNGSAQSPAAKSRKRTPRS